MTKGLFKTLIILSAMVVVLVGFGQACSMQGMNTIISSKASGNGGGYGGMVSTIGGRYGDGRQGEAGPVTSRSRSFYLFGQQTGCTSYPAGWEIAGPSIAGILKEIGVVSSQQTSMMMISVEETSGVSEGSTGEEGSIPMETKPSSDAPFTYASSACAAPVDVHSGVFSVTFADDYRIYNDSIFIGADSPPTVAQIVRAVASCSSIQRLALDGTPDASASGIATGTDVLIYKQNDRLMTRFLQGRYLEGQFMTAVVPLFESLEVRTADTDVFTALGFRLAVARNGQKHTSGVLTGTLDGKSLSLNMECWLHEP